MQNTFEGVLQEARHLVISSVAFQGSAVFCFVEPLTSVFRTVAHSIADQIAFLKKGASKVSSDFAPSSSENHSGRTGSLNLPCAVS